MVPPCINKYYILDLQPENSFVRYASSRATRRSWCRGATCRPSWATSTWDDYLEQGVIEALDVGAAICRRGQVNALGFCVGGTLLGTRARGARAAPGQIASARLTLLATMLDFSDTGDIGVFVDATSSSSASRIREPGVLPGAELASRSPACAPTTSSGTTSSTTTSRAARRGRSTCCTGTPTAPTCRARCMPTTCATCTSRTTCGSRQADDVRRAGGPAAASTCRPTCSRRARTTSCRGRPPTQASTCSGPRTEFVLGASGHIAGIINPASKNRRHYWIGAAADDGRGGLARQRNATCGKLVDALGAVVARHAGEQRAGASASRAMPTYPAIEPAPGRYVKEKSG